jgi:hypothetical protein
MGSLQSYKREERVLSPRRHASLTSFNWHYASPSSWLSPTVLPSPTLKGEERKAPGATHAPSFQHNLAFNLPMLSAGYGFLSWPARTRPASTLISNVIVFPRGSNRTWNSEDRTLPTVKWGSQHEQRPYIISTAGHNRLILVGCAPCVVNAITCSRFWKY